jgi:hypothetical protein
MAIRKNGIVVDHDNGGEGEHELIVVGPNLPGSLQKKGQFHVHTAGCKDLKRNPIRSEVAQTGSLIRVNNLFEIVTWIYEPGSFDWDPEDPGDAAAYWGDFHWAPCTRAIPTGFPEAGADDDEDADEIDADDLLQASKILWAVAAMAEEIGFDPADMLDLAARLRSAAGAPDEDGGTGEEE